MKPSILAFYSKYIWPIHRIMAKRHLTPRCKRCSISSRLSPLDKEGICAICQTQRPDQKALISNEEQQTLEKQLNETFIGAVGTGKFKYDALVFFSGGKDSSFLLHKLKTDYPDLRLLAVTIDNGFMSDIAHENVKQAIAILGVDHMIINPDQGMYEKLFRYTFSHLSPKGSVYSMDILDGELRTDIGRHLAVRLGIPLVVVGLSRGQVVSSMGSVRFDVDRNVELAPREKVTTYTIDELPLNAEERKFWWSGTNTYAEEDIPRTILPLAVWDFDEEYLKQKIVELGLVSNKNTSPVVTNHTLIPLMGVLDMAKLGYSSWEYEFTPMIRAGKADPVYWRNLFEMIEYAAKTGAFIGGSVDPMLKRLDLSRADVGLPTADKN